MLSSETLWEIWWFCHSAWYWHYGLHCLSSVLHVWAPWQTCHPHWLSGTQLVSLSLPLTHSLSHTNTMLCFSHWLVKAQHFTRNYLLFPVLRRTNLVTEFDDERVFIATLLFTVVCYCMLKYIISTNMISVTLLCLAGTDLWNEEWWERQPDGGAAHRRTVCHPWGDWGLSLRYSQDT